MGRYSNAIQSIKSGWKSFVHSNTGKSFLGGLATFFGFEWISSGGIVDSTSGALGISNAAGSLLIVCVVILVIYLAFRYLDSRIPNRPVRSPPRNPPKKGSLRWPVPSSSCSRW